MKLKLNLTNNYFDNIDGSPFIMPANTKFFVTNIYCSSMGSALFIPSGSSFLGESLPDSIYKTGLTFKTADDQADTNVLNDTREIFMFSDDPTPIMFIFTNAVSNRTLGLNINSLSGLIPEYLTIEGFYI